MGLFKPEIGLVFWMLVVFLIILAILAKYAWPVIIRSIEQRADFIDSGVKFTREAKQRNMQGKLKNRFAKEWARRYGLYRKYYDYGFDDNVFLDDKISLAALSKKLYSMAFAYHSAKRKEESES